MFRAGRKKGGLGYAESLHYIKINLKRIKNIKKLKLFSWTLLIRMRNPKKITQ